MRSLAEIYPDFVVDLKHLMVQIFTKTYYRIENMINTWNLRTKTKTDLIHNLDRGTNLIRHLKDLINHIFLNYSVGLRETY